ncbi:molybdopterin-dependent oxidoreductase [Alicyclobacillus macrosporangiidus]|uniref:molybdopterin-dependent oxidoreductase n=1 Tax=Alicyclobacillus macrosporangiidus TaxID=392015 RepID=UPI003AFA3720
MRSSRSYDVPKSAKWQAPGRSSRVPVDVLLAFQMAGTPLPRNEGGPAASSSRSCRYKSVKWVGRMEFTTDRQIGY